MNLSWKQVLVTGLAVVGAFAAVAYLRGQGGVLGAVLGTDRDLALKRFIAGPKAVAESAKQVAAGGPEAFAAKKASEAMVKS